MSNQWLPLGVILVLAGVLTLVMQEFINESVILPLLYLVWIGHLILKSIPQEIIWSLFLGAAAIYIWKSVLTKRKQGKRHYPPFKKQPGYIESWLKLIRQAKQETYYQWRLAQRLRKLTLEALAHDERLTRRQIRRRLANNQLDIPAEIQAYLRASITSFVHLPGRPHRFFRRRSQPSPLELEPEKVAQFLEERFNL